MASNILIYVSRGEKSGHHTDKCICIIASFLWLPLPQILILLQFQIIPLLLQDMRNFSFFFFFFLPPDVESVSTSTKALDRNSVWVSRTPGKDLQWIPPILCPWNWGLSTKQISLSEGFSRGATRSASRCRQHILFTASAPGKAFIQQQAQTLRHGNGGLCWQLFCLCAQRAHSSTKGQAACWWAEAVYTDVALGRQG